MHVMLPLCSCLYAHRAVISRQREYKKPRVFRVVSDSLVAMDRRVLLLVVFLQVFLLIATLPSANAGPPRVDGAARQEHPRVIVDRDSEARGNPVQPTQTLLNIFCGFRPGACNLFGKHDSKDEGGKKKEILQ